MARMYTPFLWIMLHFVSDLFALCTLKQHSSEGWRGRLVRTSVAQLVSCPVSSPRLRSETAAVQGRWRLQLTIFSVVALVMWNMPSEDINTLGCTLESHAVFYIQASARFVSVSHHFEDRWWNDWDAKIIIRRNINNDNHFCRNPWCYCLIRMYVLAWFVFVFIKPNVSFCNKVDKVEMAVVLFSLVCNKSCWDEMWDLTKVKVLSYSRRFIYSTSIRQSCSLKVYAKGQCLHTLLIS